MTNGEKILISILLGITIIMFFVFNNNFNEIEDSTVEETNTIMDYFEQDKENKNVIIQNEAKSENIVENKVSNEVKNEIKNQTKDEVVGKEEQESKKENVGLTNEQKAIKLAQDEWGISINSYIFEAEIQSKNTYRVTVRSNNSNRTTVAVYIVNVENEIVTEE